MINIGNVVAGSDGLDAGVNSTYFYFRSTGYLIPSVTGLYTVGCNASDGVNIFIGTQSLVHNLTGSDVANATLKYTQSGTIMLTAGVYYPLTVEWQHGGGANYELQLMWTLPVSGGPAVTQLIPSANTSTASNSITSNINYAFWNGTYSVWYPTGPGVVDPSSSIQVLPKGSIPSSGSVPFRISATNSSITLSTTPSAFFARIDGSDTLIGATSYSVSGLAASTPYYFFPYWDETTGSIKFVLGTDATIPSLTGITCAAASSQWVETTTSASIPTTGFSFEIWVKGTTAASQALMSYFTAAGVTPSTGIVMQAWIFPVGDIGFTIWNGSTWSGLLGVPVVGALNGNWHHIACTYTSANGGDTAIYMDGILLADYYTVNSTGTGTIANTSGRWHIGYVVGQAGAGLTSNTYNSLTIGPTSVYNFTLTQAEILTHFNAFIAQGATLYEAEVVADGATNLWKLNETGGTTAADSIGSNTGTYEGSPTLNQSSASISVIGTPPAAWPYQTIKAMQLQSLSSHIPLSAAAIQALTTASSTPVITSGGGTSGGTNTFNNGSGGTNGGCFTGDTPVKTAIGIPRAIIDTRRGDLVLTAKGTWRPVLALIVHEAELRTMHRLPGGGLVTFDHQILIGGEWIKAGLVYTDTIDVNEPVYTLSVSSEEPESNGYSPTTEHSFTLEDGTIATNNVYQK